jgi:diguanylate cyclase (GGDEF)-like protein/excisionase family DNA binding protein
VPKTRVRARTTTDGRRHAVRALGIWSRATPMALAARPNGATELLTLAQAADVAGVRRETVRAWCAKGRLPSTREGKRRELRLRRVDLERWLATRTSALHAVRVAQPAGPPGRPGVARPARRRADLWASAASVGPHGDLDAVFQDVLDNSARLFHADRAGLWVWDPVREPPLALAASRNLPAELEALTLSSERISALAAVRSLRSQSVLVFRDASDPIISSELRAIYVKNGIASVCFVPAVFRGEPQAILVLYHNAPHQWTEDDVAVARSFGDTVATAIGNARLTESVEDLARRLKAIQGLAQRLSGIQDLRGIGETIVAEAGALIDYDSIRVYRVDRDTGWCEPVAFEGVFPGTADPSPDQLRVRIGQGLTGWVAEHGEPIVLGDARADARSLFVGQTDATEPMLVVPMVYEGRVRGVIVAARLGRSPFRPEDETMLSIFAGAAVQALVNAERLDQLRQQQQELEHQLVSQRRLMAVNEQLLSTLDPSGVLEMIADSLKSVVAYDSLTIYRVDLERGVRRPVIARDRFAELILGYDAPLGIGLTGWAVDHHEPVLANDAHLDPRSIQIPGTPFEPESMVIVPLMAEGEVLGTLNIGRMGGAEAHYSQNEFELTKLFAAQAAIAMRNAEAHDEVKVQAERDALTGLRNHGSFQRELQAYLAAGEARQVAVLMMDLDQFKSYNDRNGHPAGDDLLVGVGRAIEGCIRQGDRAYRYGGDEFAVILPDCPRAPAEEVARRIRAAVAGIPDETGGPHVTISVGVACHPEDAQDKDTLVETADQALFLAKGSPFRNARDQYAAALDETAAGLLAGGQPDALLDSILNHAARLLGVRTGYLYLVEPGGQELVVRAGIGVMADFVGYRMPIERGLSGTVYRTAAPVVVDDYDNFEGRDEAFLGRVGASLGVPLSVAEQIVGVLGLASGTTDRTFRQSEVDALTRFAQLASIALENARLHEQALSPRDPVTGLPARETLIQRLVEALAAPLPAADREPMAVVLLDVDRFEIVNESLGHAAGDRVLKEVGARIRSVLGERDTVARFGGDTFAVLLPGSDVDGAMATADRIQLELKPPFDLDGRTWFISASMGVSVGAPGSSGAGDVLQEAEIALVTAKRQPARRVALFDAATSRPALERVDLEAELWAALDHDELTVHYQPILDLETDRVIGFEALARWQHPGRGLVLPVDFIALAEESDLIVAIGRVILEKACRQAQAWRQRWPDQELVMSVNLSPRQFLDPELAHGISQVLQATGLDPHALELEITESSVMDRSEQSLSVLRQLRSLGVHVILDDFGTGYSSLAYLRQLPLDTIKIDRSFVTELDIQDPNLGIVRAVVSLAHGLGITVVAEGIETEDQARRLRGLGCDLGQGYHWAHPADAGWTSAYVAQSLALAAQRAEAAQASTLPRPRPAGFGRRGSISGGRRAAGAGTGTG